MEGDVDPAHSAAHELQQKASHDCLCFTLVGTQTLLHFYAYKQRGADTNAKSGKAKTIIFPVSAHAASSTAVEISLSSASGFLRGLMQSV
jgi:hypothetical protein